MVDMKKLERSTNKKAIYGICGGISEFFGINVFIIRFIFIITFPVSIWIYAVLNFRLPIKKSL
jgi:phage shock protein PspC (stress-responsive transcriptional regulator)